MWVRHSPQYDLWCAAQAVDAVTRQLHLQHVAGIAAGMQHGGVVAPCWGDGGTGADDDGARRISFLASSELLLLQRPLTHAASKEQQSTYFQHVRVETAGCVFRCRSFFLSLALAVAWAQVVLTYAHPRLVWCSYCPCAPLMRTAPASRRHSLLVTHFSSSPTSRRHPHFSSFHVPCCCHVQVDVFRTLLVALPVCVGQNHWVAVALHMKQRVIAVYDSWQVHPKRASYNREIKHAALAYVVCVSL